MCPSAAVPAFGFLPAQPNVERVQFLHNLGFVFSASLVTPTPSPYTATCPFRLSPSLTMTLHLFSRCGSVMILTFIASPFHCFVGSALTSASLHAACSSKRSAKPTTGLLIFLTVMSALSSANGLPALVAKSERRDSLKYTVDKRLSMSRRQLSFSYF